MHKNTVLRLLTCTLLIGCLLSLSACAEKAPETGLPGSKSLIISATDYSDMDNWLRFGGDASADADIFAVYPTLANSEDADDNPYIRIYNSDMRDAASAWECWSRFFPSVSMSTRRFTVS